MTLRMHDPVGAAESTPMDYREPTVRLGQLLDGDSIDNLHDPDDTGVQAVRGRIEGARVVAYCTDGSRKGGAIGWDGAQHIVRAINTAIHDRVPVIGVWHSGGAKLAEGVLSMDGVGQMFAAMTRASGKVLQLSVVVGPAAGAAAYGPALTDFVIMSESGRMFVTGPDVVHSVTGERIDMEGLGGPEPHSRKSGVVHVSTTNEAEAYATARRLTSMFTKPGMFELQSVEDERDLRALLPERQRRAYDVRPLVREICDRTPRESEQIPTSTFDELQPHWAPNVVIGLGRLAGRTVGVIANNPLRKGGCLDSLSAEKTSRFVRTCDSFGVPLLVIVDVPGYIPGVGQEWGGVIRRGAKLLHAFAESVVPRITLVTRKSYGGAYIAMNSRSLGATAVFAWPNAEVAVMGAEAAVSVLHRKQLAAAPEGQRETLRAELIEEQRQVAGGVGRALSIGVVDEVIDPKHTRRRLAAALAAAPAGRGHHGNIPL